MADRYDEGGRHWWRNRFDRDLYRRYPSSTGRSYEEDYMFERRRADWAGTEPTRRDYAPSAPGHYEPGTFGYGYDRHRYGHGRDFRAADYDRSRYTWRGYEPTTSENWMTPGPHTGRGPRGYQRADEHIVEDVCERLTWHGRVDARGIEVQVDDGVVTLRGQVNGRREKRLAEDVAESVGGVRDTRNELEIEIREPRL